MKQCLSCGNRMKEESDFCDKCGAKFGETKVKKAKKKKPFLIIIVFLVIASAIVGGLFIFGVFGKKTYELDVYEAVSYARLRVAEATSALYGTGTLSKDDFNLLGNMVKKYDGNSQWFSGYSPFYSRTADTDKYDVTYLCDDNYCAKFVTEDIQYGSYKLIEYTFESSKEKGYRIYIVNSTE